MTELLLVVGSALLAGILGWLVGRRRTKEAVALSPVPLTDLPASDPPELAWIGRANGALGVWLRSLGYPETRSVIQPLLPSDTAQAISDRLPGLRTIAGGGHTGLERLEEGSLVFVAAEDFQVAMLLPPRAPHARPMAELEQLVATLRSRGTFEAASARSPAGGESVESIAVRLAFELERLMDAEVAIAVRLQRGAQVLGTALRADPHLHRITAAPGSPVDLIIRGELTHSVTAFEPLGILPGDRRNRERRAYVVPITGPGGPVGAAVLWTAGGGEPAGPFRAELEKAVHRTGRMLEDALQQLELKEQATRDPLTGLANRRGLENAMASVKVGRGSVICLDLDHFKSLNDALGHPAGDAALGFVSRIIQDTVRDRDHAGRVGGEEFAIWLPDTPLEEATKVAERLRSRIAGRAWGWQGRPWPITASFGVSGWPESTRSKDNLLTLADRALYRAKDEGRNRVVVWESP